MLSLLELLFRLSTPPSTNTLLWCVCLSFLNTRDAQWCERKGRERGGRTGGMGEREGEGREKRARGGVGGPY